MARFTRLIEALSESFRRGGARSLTYFHTDHFEPWRSMDGRVDVSAPNGEDIVDFLDQTSKLDFARRLTLFLKPAYRLAPAGGDVRSAEGDGLGFRPLTAHETQVHDEALGYIARSSHELQIHLHHEYYTRNDMYATQARYNQDEKLRRYLGEQTTPSLDEDRFKLLAQMTLEDYRRGSGETFRRWFFVHGMWALNGSDRDVCNIDREIALLLEMGCLGDFTFPAGRAHTDPVHKAPFFCRGVEGAKCYDLAEAEPRFAYGAPARGDFFIWASPIKHLFSSIDYYSREIRANLEDLERAAQELVQTSVFIDGQLFLKTHAHSMNTDYFESVRRPIYPHFHPGVQALLGVVFDAASDAGLDVKFATAGEVYDRFTAAQYAGSTEIASEIHTIRHHETAQDLVIAMTPLERLETFGHLAVSVSQSVVGRRLDELGETESGAYAYYADLLERGSLVHAYEFAIARYLAESLPDGARIHEFGTGFGSLALLLAVAGFEVLGIDADPRRLATASAIRTELGRQVPWVAGRLNFKEAAIPAVLPLLDCEGVTAVATDVTSGLPLNEQGALIEAVAALYRSVVFDPERFFSRANTPVEIAQVRAHFLRYYDVCAPITENGRLYLEATPLANVEKTDVRGLAPDDHAPTPQQPARRWTGPYPFDLESAADLVDEIGVAVMNERIDRLGLEGSGAGAFYGHVVAQGRLVQAYDIALARWILDHIPTSTPLLEIGAGVGALAMVLAVAGRRIVALDLDARRIALGGLIRQRISDAMGHDLAHLGFVTAKFPVEPSPVTKATGVAIITNMVFGWNEAQQKAMLSEVGSFQSSIIDADRFGVKRATVQDRKAFDAMAASVGLTMTPLDLIDDTRFVRLVRATASSKPARITAEVDDLP